MCYICTEVREESKAKVNLHIYNNRPGEGYQFLKKSEKGCTYLFYNQEKQILKFHCKDFEAYRYWFPKESQWHSTRESDFWFDSITGWIKSFFVPDDTDVVWEKRGKSS